MKKRFLSFALTLCLCLTLLPMAALADNTAPASVTLRNGGWPYGKQMSQTSVTLVMEATGEGLTYQWQSKAKDGTNFANIDGETGAELTLTSPDSGTWYRCVVNGTESEAVQVVTPVTGSSGDVNGRVWTGARNVYSGTTKYYYYITNGTVAYTSNVGSSATPAFDVTGLYVKEGKSYMMQTSYSQSWEMYSSSSGTPAATSTKNASLSAFKAAFDKADSCALHFTAVLAEGQKSFAIGADTMLGSSSMNSYADNAALVADLSIDGTLKQVKMIGAATEAAAQEADPAFVIAPKTTATNFWIGFYSSRKAYTYNTDKSGNGGAATATVGETENVVTSVEKQDSGMTLSWLNVTGEVQFQFKVGTAAATGAIGGGSISSPTGTTNVELNGHSELDASKITVKVNGAALPTTAYTATITSGKLSITFHESAGLKYGDTIVAEVGKKEGDGVETIAITNNIPAPEQTPETSEKSDDVYIAWLMGVLAARHRCESECPICGGCMNRKCSNEKCEQKCQMPGIHAAEACNAKYR